MIKSNLMPSLRSQKPKQSAKQVLGKPKPLKLKIVPKKKSSDSGNGGGASLGSNAFYMLFFGIIAFVVYLELFGVPSFLRGVIPQEVVDILGLTEETTAKQVLREAGAPTLTAQGKRADDPTIPVNGSVEEVVKTMRPDIYLKGKVLTDYKEQALSDRVPYQKQAFHIMLSTFYKATPDGIGYLDLAYQAPNFFFARAVAIDARTRTSFMDGLRNKVLDLAMSDSATIKDGNVEFSIHGGINQPNFKDLKHQPLLDPAKINAEVLALRNLSIQNQVRLNGLEKPVEEKFGTYRRVTIKTTTEADYPSLLNFAEALQKSNIAFGVQQFVSRPAGAEKMQSGLEFVLYSAM
ncbi:hypothetical protein AGMMS49938_08330 [Fibrobacterales bacterium]|nr:hypothetical protein AGMMS49938_08330 [Fibrobacterales bacterium]